MRTNDVGQVGVGEIVGGVKDGSTLGGEGDKAACLKARVPGLFSPAWHFFLCSCS